MQHMTIQKTQKAERKKSKGYERWKEKSVRLGLYEVS